LNAETGPRKSPPETTCPLRDQEGPESIAEIPAQKAYLNLTGNYPIPKDCVVGTTGIEPVTPTMSTKVRSPETVSDQPITLQLGLEHRQIGAGTDQV